jgi:hypothetical protein
MKISLKRKLKYFFFIIRPFFYPLKQKYLCIYEFKRMCKYMLFFKFMFSEDSKKNYKLITLEEI